jgi:ankyrin repeat protein
MKALVETSVNDVDLRRQLVEIAFNNDNVRRKLLFNAIEKNDVPLVKFVLNGGMNLNFAYNHKGYWDSPLEMALRFGYNIEILRLLFQSGADPNFIHHNEITPLALAVGSEDPQVVQLFMDYGANPNLGNNKGLTAYDALNQMRYEYNMSDNKYNELYKIMSVDIEEPYVNYY